MTFRDFVFRIRYGFRGAPVSIGGGSFRIDESLRRWNFGGEQEVQDALVQNLKPGDTAIDIGANFGMHTLLMSRCVSSRGAVMAFEPIPENLRLLRRNISLNALNRIVTIHPTAVSDLCQSELEMAVDTTGLEPSASLKTASSGDKPMTRVKNTSLDLACSNLNPDGGCLVKIDVEGAELSVLRSGQEFLRRVRPKLLIEVHTYALPSFGESAENVHAFLEQHGYQTSRLSDMANSNGQYYHVLASPKTA